jgi:Tfp pilus assembly protein PilX
MKNFRRPSRRHEQGIILAIVLMISVFMAILALPFMTKLSGRYKTSERVADTLAARYLAEAGVERAIWELNYGNISTWGGSSSQRTLTMSNVQSSGGTIIGNVAITVFNPADNIPVIQSTGSVIHTASATINTTIRVTVNEPPHVFDFAIFGITKVNIHEQAYVDSYYSASGVYGGDNVHANATVGSNTPASDKIVKVSDYAIVNGDANCGYQTDPAQRIDVEGNAVVTGTKTALSAAKTYAPATAPTGLPNLGNVKIGDNQTATISSSGKYGTLEIGNHATLNITGDVTLHITAKLKTDDTATLNVAAGAKLTVVLDHDNALEMNDKSIITTASLSPSDFSILGTANATGDLTFQSQSNFYGSIYLPLAKFKFDHTPQVFGSVIANEIELKGTTQLHYDEALTGYLPNGVGKPGPHVLKVTSWQRTA